MVCACSNSSLASDTWYKHELSVAQSEDFLDLEELQFSRCVVSSIAAEYRCTNLWAGHSVANVNGKTVWIIYGSRLPMTVLDKERVFRYAHWLW